MLADRFDQFQQRVRFEILARLQGTWGDAVETDALDFHLAARATIPYLTEPWYC